MDTPPVTPVANQLPLDPVETLPPVSPQNFFQKLWQKIAVGFFLICIVTLVIYEVKLFFFDTNFIVADQPRASTLTIKKLVLSRGGFLAVERAGIVDGAVGTRVAQTSYVPPGTYTDFQLPYVSRIFTKYPAASYKMIAYIYEDTNGNKKNDPADQLMTDLFGSRMVRKFTMTESVPPQAASCTEGVTDSFSGTQINKATWDASVFNVQNGAMIQRAQYNGPQGMGETALYTKKTFTGDISGEVTIANYHGEKEDVSGAASRFEFTLGGLFSVAWVKNKDGSYAKLIAPPEAKDASVQTHPMAGAFPIKIKLQRIGSRGDVWMDEGNGYVRIWSLHNIPASDVHLGFLTADEGDPSQLVITQLANITIACPN